MNNQQDKAVFQVTDYYELLALHSALWVARFARNPVKPELPGSPFLADAAKRIVETLARMEVERGHPERADGWQRKAVPDSSLWEVIVQNASINPDIWRKWSTNEKQSFAQICLSPLIITDEILDEFVRQVDERCKI